ncbi:MAG TPA: Clp protease N-terminal domain-containing protein, partial [Phycisphaerales bacterium]|nr:Clp protease N-terminal domain-containing protein [Phycisphaerales bacterium]
MKLDRFTTAAQEALAAAQQEAMARGNPEVTGLHILGALLSEQGSPTWSLVQRAGADAGRLAGQIKSELGRLPKTTSGAGATGRAIIELLGKAEQSSKSMEDAFVSTEHLLLALAEVAGPAKELLGVNALD